MISNEDQQFINFIDESQDVFYTRLNEYVQTLNIKNKEIESEKFDLILQFGFYLIANACLYNVKRQHVKEIFEDIVARMKDDFEKFLDTESCITYN